MSIPRPSAPLIGALLAIAATTAVVLPASATASRQLPALLSCAGKRLVRPTGMVVIACADANAELLSTRWSSWTASAATGTTDWAFNLCMPTCAASKITDFRDSSVRLSQPTRTSHGLVFEKVTVHYRLHGKTETYSD
jgi:hypothetical protein